MIDYGALLEEYLAGITRGNIKRLRTQLSETIGYFAKRGIYEPTEADYLGLREYLSAKPSKKNGIKQTEKTTSDWIIEARKFYEWQKGENKMPEIFKMQEDSQILDTESEKVSDVEVVEQEAAVDEAEMGNIEPLPAKPKHNTGHNGGRKPKYGEKASVKIGLYITPEQMADLRAIATMGGLSSVTDCIIRLIEKCREKNQGALEHFFSGKQELDF